MMDPTKERHQILWIAGKCDGDPGNGQRSGKKARAIHGKSELTEIDKGEIGEELGQEHAHHFLRDQGDSS
jgi:hypothetical protein